MILDSVLNKIENQFDRLERTYPGTDSSKTAIQLRHEVFLALKKRNPKLEVYCNSAPDAKATDENSYAGQACFDESKIRLNLGAEMFGSFEELESVIYHELYHFLSGGHQDPWVDYTVVCSAEATDGGGYGVYLSEDDSRRSFFEKMCATGGTFDLVSEEYVRSIVMTGSKTMRRNWLASLNRARLKKTLPLHAVETLDRALTHQTINDQLVGRNEFIFMNATQVLFSLLKEPGDISVEEKLDLSLLALVLNVSFDKNSQSLDDLYNKLLALSERRRQELIELTMGITFQNNHYRLTNKFLDFSILIYDVSEWGSKKKQIESANNDWILQKGRTYRVELFTFGRLNIFYHLTP